MKLRTRVCRKVMKLNPGITLKEAVDFLLNEILHPFAESDLYKDYRDDPSSPFSDEHYEQALAKLEDLLKVL